QQNALLRAQWGQATMEINRLRAQLETLRGGAGVAGGTPQPAADTPRATPGTATAAAANRLREENEDLRRRNRELTALAGLGPQDERVATQAARINSAFNKRTGRTVVRTQQERLHMTAGSRADHFLSLAYSYEG